MVRPILTLTGVQQSTQKCSKVLITLELQVPMGGDNRLLSRELFSRLPLYVT